MRPAGARVRPRPRACHGPTTAAAALPHVARHVEPVVQRAGVGPVAAGREPSHGRHCQLDTPHHISFVFLNTKYNKARLDGSTARGCASRGSPGSVGTHLAWDSARSKAPAPAYRPAADVR